MNRKLHHTLKALLATAGVFGVLLLAAGPVSQTPRPVAPLLALGALPAAAVAIDATAPAGASERRHLRHSRALLAMPYFSFAQGLRRNRS
jgi:hypothetical protein